jgi:hypothetical protein
LRGRAPRSVSLTAERHFCRGGVTIGFASASCTDLCAAIAARSVWANTDLVLNRRVGVEVVMAGGVRLPVTDVTVEFGRASRRREIFQSRDPSVADLFKFNLNAFADVRAIPFAPFK